MNEHIKHLEEPLYVGDINNVNLNFIDIVYSKQFSIKIDGSPSIFFGRDDGKFFIATKSIFNKNKKLYFSTKEIDNNVNDAELAQKLKNCFERLKYDFTENIIYQADLISWTKNINGVYQPNIIQYKLDNDNDINFSIHTSYYDLNLVEKEYNDDIFHECNHNNTVKIDDNLFEKMLGKYHEWQENVFYFKKHIHDENLHKVKILSTKDIPIERYFNNCIRTHIAPSKKSFNDWFIEKHFNAATLKKKNFNQTEYLYFIENSINIYNEDWFNYYIEMYNYTTDFKNNIIEDLDEYVKCTKLDNHVTSFDILNINNNHEGYVFNANCKKIKMVNRDEFSYHNFMKHGG